MQARTYPCKDALSTSKRSDSLERSEPASRSLRQHHPRGVIGDPTLLRRPISLISASAEP